MKCYKVLTIRYINIQIKLGVTCFYIGSNPSLVKVLEQNWSKK